MIPSALLLTLLAAAEAPVARVDGVEITAEQLRGRIAETRAAGGSVSSDAILQDLVNEVLLAKEAEKAGLGKAPAVIAATEAARRGLAARSFEQLELSVAGQIDDVALKAMFHDSSDSVRYAAILVATEPEAKALLTKLQGGADFAKEAQGSLSVDTAQKGGDQGVKSRGQLTPEVAAALFAAPVGKLAGPVKLGMGWAIVRVDAKTIGDDVLFEARKNDLRRFAEKQAGMQAKHHFVEQLRKSSGVKLDDAFLTATAKRLDPTPAEAKHVLAKVHGREVTYGEVVADVERLTRGKSGGHFSGMSVKVELAWARIDQLLIEQAAIERGHGARPEVEREVAGVRRNALVRAWAEQLRASMPAATPAELSAVWEQRRVELGKQRRRVCSHLVAATKEQAEALGRRALAGEAFSELAKAYSLDRVTAPAGGLLGELDEAQLTALAGADGEPELARALREAKDGLAYGPVKSRMGQHLVLCQPAVSNVLPPLEQIRDELAAIVARDRADAEIRRRIQALRSAAQISIDPVAQKRALGQ